jgi:hypothetical protein
MKNIRSRHRAILPYANTIYQDLLITDVSIKLYSDIA